MERIIDGKKKCSKCKEVKAIDCFGPNKNIKSGILSFCRSCAAESMRLYKKQNEDHFDKYHIEYRNKNREKINAYHRKYKQDRNPNFGKPVVMLRNKNGQYSQKVNRVII